MSGRQENRQSKKALIVGSGIAGLASAIRLRRLGFDVEVFEKNAYPGGKLTSFKLGAYHFDAGPSLFTMPHLVEELLEKNILEYVKSETACHYFWEDDTVIKFPADIKQLINEVPKQLNVAAEPLKKHFERSKYIYDKTHKVFIERSLHKLNFNLDLIKAIIAIPKLFIFNTMHRVNKRKLNHPKLVQIFDRYATYNGSSPYLAPGILNIIPHLEHGIGTFFPTNGMQAITDVLVKEATELGVVFHYNQKVEKIIVQSKICKGLETNDSIFKGEIVVCNSDIKPAYNYLLKGEKKPKKTMEQEPSSSALIFYWGIDKKFEELDLHNILFSENYEQEFEAIFKDKTIYEDPTVYIHVSSKIVKNSAPLNGENWFVMINVPYNSGQDWEKLREKARKYILEKINRILKTDIEKHIVCEDYLDPIRIEERTSSFGGALYGASSNDRMAAFFRHPNFSKVKGLYFVGGSVHPGGGIPLCLNSAKIACEIIAKDF